MKTYNQIKAYFNLGPVDMHRPIADIGNMKSPYNRPRFGINASKKKKEKKENNIKDELAKVKLDEVMLDVDYSRNPPALDKAVKAVGKRLNLKLMGKGIVDHKGKARLRGDVKNITAFIEYLYKKGIMPQYKLVKEERNYRNEYDNYHKKPEQRERNAARLRARRLMDRWGKVKRFDKKDVHHKDNNPLNNEEDNLAVTTQKWNRTEPRLRLTKSIRGK